MGGPLPSPPLPARAGGARPGSVVAALPGERTDAARAAELLAGSFGTAKEAFDARTYGPPGLEADIAWCAQENLLDTVPRFVRMDGPAAEIVA